MLPWLYNGVVPIAGLPDDNFDTIGRDGLKLVEEYEAQPLRDTSSVVPRTKEDQERAWVIWTRFFSAIKRDPEDIIFDLCRGKTDGACKKSAVDHCKAFFETYVERSVKIYPTLGPEEYEWKRTIESAGSVLSLWGLIVGYADSTFLQKKRNDDPDNAAKWRLTFDTVGKRSDGPVHAVTLWITQDLADKLNLSRDQLFVKREATEEDVVLFASTLWGSAQLIACDPDTRIAMHTAVLSNAVGGFRSRETLGMLYRDVELAVMRDPVEQDRTRLVATITVKRSKTETKAVKKGQADVLTFSVTSAPCQAIDLVGNLAAIAISHDAFDPSFASIEELLSRPRLEHTDYLPLKWKDEVLDKPIIDLQYWRYWTLWNRVIHVCCLRTGLRPYSLRVGTGARLNGTLTSALRNYVMSHTEAMYQESYQPRHVCENLLERAFGRDRAGDDGPLFALLRNSSLKRDEFAPIDPTTEELQGFEQRQDFRLLRARYAETTEKKAREDLRAQMSYLRQILSRLLVQKKRQEYFAEVDRLRSLGLSTDSLRGGQPEAPSGIVEGGAVAIGRFLDSGRCEGRMDLYVTLFVSYLRRRPAEVVILAGQASDPVNRTTHDPRRSRCLLGCGSFFRRSGLTRHMQRFHLDTGTFDHPFLCPECLVSSPAQQTLINGLSDWCSHTKAEHQRKDAPELPSTASYTPRRPRVVHEKPPKTLACPICARNFCKEDGLKQHITVVHFKKGYFKNRVFLCPECQRVGMEPAQIDSYEAFTDHCAKVHGTPIRTSHRGRVARDPAESKRKREASGANMEPADGREVPTKRRRKIVGNAASGGGTLRIELSSQSPPAFDKIFRSESAVGDPVPLREAARGSPSLPPQPPNTSALPCEMASSVGGDDRSSPDPFAFWSNPDLTQNPWLSL